MLRFIKSGIEYVILAGSSLFQLSRAESRFLTVKMADLARAQPRFFQGFGAFGHLKLKIFAGPQVPVLRVASQLCNVQVLEYLLGLIGYCKY